MAAVSQVTCTLIGFLLGFTPPVAAFGQPLLHMQSPVVTSPQGDQRAAGRDLFDRRQYDAAARVFETLWAQQRLPDDLHNAAAARFAAGHFAHAFAEYSTYLATLPPQAQNRAAVTSQLQAARNECQSLEVNLRTPDAHDAFEVVVTRVANAQTVARPPLPVVLRPATNNAEVPVHHGEIPLDPGLWQLEVRGPNGFVETQTVEITTSRQIVQIEAGTHSQAPKHAAIGLVVYGGFAAVTGGALAGVGAARQGKARGEDSALPELPASLCADSPEAVRRQCQRGSLLVQGIGISSTGFGLIGFGIGSLASGSTHWIARDRARRITQFSLLGVGIASLAGGALGLGLSNLDDDLNELAAAQAWDTAPPRSYRGYAASSLFTGLGAGLTVGTAVMLLLPKLTGKRPRTSQISPAIGRGFAGLHFNGSF